MRFISMLIVFLLAFTQRRSAILTSSSLASSVMTSCAIHQEDSLIIKKNLATLQLCICEVVLFYQILASSKKTSFNENLGTEILQLREV